MILEDIFDNPSAEEELRERVKGKKRVTEEEHKEYVQDRLIDQYLEWWDEEAKPRHYSFLNGKTLEEKTKILEEVRKIDASKDTPRLDKVSYAYECLGDKFSDANDISNLETSLRFYNSGLSINPSKEVIEKMNLVKGKIYDVREADKRKELADEENRRWQAEQERIKQETRFGENAIRVIQIIPAALTGPMISTIYLLGKYEDCDLFNKINDIPPHRFPELWNLSMITFLPGFILTWYIMEKIKKIITKNEKPI